MCNICITLYDILFFYYLLSYNDIIYNIYNSINSILVYYYIVYKYMYVFIAKMIIIIWINKCNNNK